MKLLTKEIAKKIPPIYSTEDVPAAEKTIPAKFFTPWSNWTWYVIEGCAEFQSGEEIIDVPLAEADLKDPTLLDVRFFGYVEGLDSELGYFSLRELESVSGPGGIKIERDKFWDPSTKLGKVM